MLTRSPFTYNINCDYVMVNWLNRCLWDVIAHPYPTSIDDFAKPLLKSKNGIIYPCQKHDADLGTLC